MAVLAQRMGRLGTESAFSVLAEVKRLEAEGRHIINFGIGEPDFDTPHHIKEAAIKALEAGETHYTPSPGIMPLREAVARYVAKTRGIPVEPAEVVITPGAKPIMFYTVLALVEPGDEVIVPNPGFPIYASVVSFAGGRPVPVPLREERDFRIDVEALVERVGPRTRLIILNSPHNPTGSVLTREDLEEIARVAERSGCWILSDEIYSRIVFDHPFSSILQVPGMKARTILLDGFSKTYAMTGWRLGYGVMPEPLAEGVARLVTNCESCTAAFTQHAGIAALEGPQDAVDQMVAEYKARRDLVVRLLRDMPGVTCRIPGGAFYVFPNVTEACRRVGAPDAQEFQRRLLHEAGVGVLARSAFGEKEEGEDQEYIRISYATSRENLEEGLGRMRAWIEGH